MGEERIEKATKEKEEKTKNFFHYPVFYQEFPKEKPDVIDFGKFRISLTEIIPELREKQFQTSLEFHEKLLEFLKTEKWQEKIKNNLNNYCERQFSNLDKKKRQILPSYFSEVIISILEDYKNYFEEEYNKNLNNRVQSQVEILEFNSKIATVFLDYYDSLKEIFEELGINKEVLEMIRDRNISAYEQIPLFNFIFLVILFGNYVHIGAEYGKFNEIRKKLNLTELPEPTSPQERFRLFHTEGKQPIESGTLRILFGRDIRPFIDTAVWMGYEGGSFYPLNKELLKRIRVVDFYLKQKNFNWENFFQTEISKDSFLKFLDLVNYFSHLKQQEEINQLNNLLSTLESKKQNFDQWINDYNSLLDIEKIQDNKIKSRLKINKDNLKNKFSYYLFKEYVVNPLLKIDIEELSRYIEEIFHQPLLEEIVGEPEKEKFPGLSIPFSNKVFSSLSNLDRNDLVEILSFIERSKEIQLNF